MYVGPFSFPNGGAAARRIYFNCKSLQGAGYKVIVASGQNNSPENLTCEYDNIQVVSLNERDSEHLPRWLKHLKYFKMGGATISWLDSLNQKPKAIILYSGYSPYLLRLLLWCKRNKVDLYFDAVEWYDPPNRISALTPYYLNIELAMRILLPRVKGIIAISSYLKNYYEKKGSSCQLVPPTIDANKVVPVYQYSDRKPVRLVYAGSPGHKDLLNVVILSVFDLCEKGIDVELNIAGLNDEELHEYAKHYGIESKITNNIIAHGFLSYDAVTTLVANSDYSVLVRPIKRYSTAGFSTKVVESLSLGTPVVANLTSDLGLYIKDELNGFVCRDSSVASLSNVLKRAIDMKLRESDYLLMRSKAAESARQYFHYETYNNSLKSLLEHS